MKKNFKYALMSAIAVVGAVSFSACSSNEEIVDNPDYNPETNSVKTTISLSINPNNGAATRQTSDIVQASGSPFRGIGSILCIPSQGDIATTTSTTGKLTWADINAFDGSSSNYKLYANQEVAVGVDHFLFIGKVPYTSSTAAANLANGYTSNNLSSASTVGEIAVIPVSIVASDDVSTANATTKNWKSQSDALANYLTSIANAAGWSTSTNANLLGMYQQFTRTIPTAGSAKSISLLLGDLYTKLQGLTLNETEAAIRGAIQTAIIAKATVAGSGSYTVTLNSEDWDNTFPTNFGLPEGSAEYTWNSSATTPAFEYITNGTLAALTTPIDNFVYPNELYYLTKTPLKATSSANVTWPSSVDNWTSETWASWTDAVEASSKNIALKYNVNYGSALLATTIKAGAATLYDNARQLDPDKVGVATAENNPIVVKDGDTEKNPFELTGVLIGAQPSSVAWNFLPTTGTSAATFNKVVYDNTMNGGSINVQTTANATPNYTLVFDDYKAEVADVNVCLEFKNNLTTSFYGKNGVILPGQTFYIVGKLNLTTSSPAPTNPIPTETTPNTDDELDTYFPSRALRAFIQDYTTTANFTITAGSAKGNGDGSLSEAVTTIPDLRTSSQNIGLSVDLEWKTGLRFDINLGQ